MQINITYQQRITLIYALKALIRDTQELPADTPLDPAEQEEYIDYLQSLMAAINQDEETNGRTT